MKHNIVKLAVRLGMKFIEYHAVDVQSMFGVGFSRKHLIKTAERLIDQPLLRNHRLNALLERRALLHHAAGHVKDDAGLLPVRDAAVHLAAMLEIAAGEQESDGCRKLRLALLLGDFDICGVELPVAVGLHNSEHIADDLFLPVDQFKGLAVPFAFGVIQTVDERDGVISRLAVILRAIRFVDGGFVSFELSQ